jgi:hypothetical protein
VWCFSPAIPALRRLRQEDHEFKASLDYTERPCLKIKFKFIVFTKNKTILGLKF